MPTIDHVVVLALENRSFDHLLGYLQHPDPRLEGAAGHSCSGWNGAAAVPASPDAKPVLPVDPDHSHDAVMRQLGAAPKGPNWAPTNQGFVQSYEAKGRGLATPTYGGALRRLIALVGKFFSHVAPPIKGRGPLIMRCHQPSSVPALSALAVEFALCTRWFSSVPGETWPNRNFMHAATSDGETNIYPRFYTNRTIFEVLERVGKTWRIYHDDTPQVWAFPALWESSERRANWYEFKDFADHVEQGNLANYTFIEPNHRPPLHTVDFIPSPDGTGVSDNQHPGNNIVADKNYAHYNSANPTDFSRADQLIATVYEALRKNRGLFERTILLVTYDEHGGTFDHVTPEHTISPDDQPGRITRILRSLWHRKAAPFDFTLLGVRVPALVISPFIPRATLDQVVHDHASIPATLRRVFMPKADPLGPRDQAAEPFHSLLTLPTARPDTDLPDLSHLVLPPTPPVPPEEQRRRTPVDYRPYVSLAKSVNRRLKSKGLPSAGPLLVASRRQKADRVTRAFVENAEEQRLE